MSLNVSLYKVLATQLLVCFVLCSSSCDTMMYIQMSQRNYAMNILDHPISTKVSIDILLCECELAIARSKSRH